MINTNRIQKQIILKAINSFRLYGIRYTRMDLIAAELHISKRTIYQYFPSKETLLFYCILFEWERMKEHISDLETDCASSLELMLRMDEWLFLQVSSFCPAFYQDLKVKRSAMKMIDEQLKSWIYSTFLDACTKAAEEGAVMQDTNFRFVFSFLENSIRAFYFQYQSSATEVKEIHRYTTLTYMNGICTEYGRRLIKIIGEENNNEHNIKN